MKAAPMIPADASTADRFSFEPALFLTSMSIPRDARYFATPWPYGRKALPSPAVISVTRTGICDKAGAPRAASPRTTTYRTAFHAIVVLIGQVHILQGGRHKLPG